MPGLAREIRKNRMLISGVLLVYAESPGTNALWNNILSYIASGYVPRLYSLNYQTLAKDLPADLRPSTLAKMALDDPLSVSVSDKLEFLREFCDILCQHSLTDSKRTSKPIVAPLADTALQTPLNVVIVSGFMFGSHYAQANLATEEANPLAAKPSTSLLQPHEKFALACSDARVCFGAYISVSEDADDLFSRDQDFSTLLAKLNIPATNLRGIPPPPVDASIFAYEFTSSELPAPLIVRTVPMFELSRCGKFMQMYERYETLEKLSNVPTKEEKTFLAKVKESFTEQNIILGFINSYLLELLNLIITSPGIYNEWIRQHNAKFICDDDYQSTQYYRSKEASGLKHIGYYKVNRGYMADPDGVIKTLAISDAKDKRPQKLGTSAQGDYVVAGFLQGFYEDRLQTLSICSDASFMDAFLLNDYYRLLLPGWGAEQAGGPSKVTTKATTAAKVQQSSIGADAQQESATSVFLFSEGDTNSSMTKLLDGYKKSIGAVERSYQNEVSVVLECMLMQFETPKPQREEPPAHETQKTARSSVSKARPATDNHDTAEVSNMLPKGATVTNIVDCKLPDDVDVNKLGVSAKDYMLLNTSISSNSVLSDAISGKQQSKDNARPSSQHRQSNAQVPLDSTKEAAQKCTLGVSDEPSRINMKLATSIFGVLPIVGAFDFEERYRVQAIGTVCVEDGSTVAKANPSEKQLHDRVLAGARMLEQRGLNLILEQLHASLRRYRSEDNTEPSQPDAEGISVQMSYGSSYVEFKHTNVPFSVLRDMLSAIVSYDVLVSEDTGTLHVHLGPLLSFLDTEHAHTLALFRKDYLSLFPTLPSYTAWINEPIIVDVLMSGSLSTHSCLFGQPRYPLVAAPMVLAPQPADEAFVSRGPLTKKPAPSPAGTTMPSVSSTEVLLTSFLADRTTSFDPKRLPLHERLKYLPAIVILTRRYGIPGSYLPEAPPQQGPSVDGIKGAIENSVQGSLEMKFKNYEGNMDTVFQGSENNLGGAAVSPESEDDATVGELLETQRPFYPLPAEFVDVEPLIRDAQACVASTSASTVSTILSAAYGSVGLRKVYPDRPVSGQVSNDISASSSAQDDAQVSGHAIASVQEPQHLAPKTARSSTAKQSKRKQQAPELVPDDCSTYYCNKLLSVQVSEPAPYTAPAPENEKKSKIILDFTAMADFDIGIESLAPRFDVRPASLASFGIRYQDTNGIHAIQSVPSNCSVRQLMITGRSGPLFVSLLPLETSVVKLGELEFPHEETPAISVAEAEAFIATQNCSKDRIATGKKESQSLQQIEWGRRKRRLADMQRLVSAEKDRRQEAMPKIGTDIMGTRPSSAKLVTRLPSRAISVSAVDGLMIIKYLREGFTLLLSSQNRCIVVCKEYLDVDLDRLCVEATSNPWNLLLHQFKMVYSDSKNVLCSVKVCVFIHSDKIRVYCDVNAAEGAFSIPGTDDASHERAGTSVVPQEAPNEGLGQTVYTVHEEAGDGPDNVDQHKKKHDSDHPTDHSAPDSMTTAPSRIVLFESSLVHFADLFQDLLMSSPPMPCTGSKIVNSGSQFYVSSVHSRLQRGETVDNVELTTIDLATLVPQVSLTDRVMLDYCTVPGFAEVAHVSDLQMEDSIEKLCYNPKNFMELNDKHTFENTISHLVSRQKQIIHEDPGRFMATIRELCKKESASKSVSPNVFFSLPVGISGLTDETGATVLVLNLGDATDIVRFGSPAPLSNSLQRAEMVFGNEIRLGSITADNSYYAYVADIRADTDGDLRLGEAEGVYTYVLSGSPKLISKRVRVIAGAPRTGYEFRTVGRDPYLFLPNMKSVFKPEEVFPKSLLYFTEGLRHSISDGVDQDACDSQLVSAPSPLSDLLAPHYSIAVPCLRNYSTGLLPAVVSTARTSAEVDESLDHMDIAAEDHTEGSLECHDPLADEQDHNASLRDDTHSLEETQFLHPQDTWFSSRIAATNPCVVSSAVPLSEEYLFSKYVRPISQSTCCIARVLPRYTIPEGLRNVLFSSSDCFSSSDLADLRNKIVAERIKHYSPTDASVADNSSAPPAEPQAHNPHTAGVITANMENSSDSLHNTANADSSAPMSVDYFQINASRNYWETPEGMAFLESGEPGYDQHVANYEVLLNEVLGSKASVKTAVGAIPNRNVSKYVDNWARRTTLPRNLPSIAGSVSPDRLVFPGEEGHVTLSQIGSQEMHSSICSDLVDFSLGASRTMACKNVPYKSLETLRKVTMPTKIKAVSCRRFEVFPTLLQLGEDLLPGETILGKILFKNIGILPAHLRYDRINSERTIERKIIVDCSLPQPKSGVSPGIDVTARLTFITPLTGGAFSSVAIFKSEEELIAVPIEGFVVADSSRSRSPPTQSPPGTIRVIKSDFAVRDYSSDGEDVRT